jgi:predicted ABC-type transport system involved in lysophospholipase L1 biosynthesis ATPase subunit
METWPGPAHRPIAVETVAAGQGAVGSGACAGGNLRRDGLHKLTTRLARQYGTVVTLAGRNITRMREAALTRLRRDRIGFVFQSYNLLFADEPTGALDPTTGARILGFLRDAVDRLGVTVVMVTHDPTAARVSDRLLLSRDGRLVADAPTPDAATIASRLAAVSGTGSGRVSGELAVPA